MPKWTKYRTEDRQEFVVSSDYVVTYQLGIGAFGVQLPTPYPSAGPGPEAVLHTPLP